MTAIACNIGILLPVCVLFIYLNPHESHNSFLDVLDKYNHLEIASKLIRSRTRYRYVKKCFLDCVSTDACSYVILPLLSPDTKRECRPHIQEKRCCLARVLFRVRRYEFGISHQFMYNCVLLLLQYHKIVFVCVVVNSLTRMSFFSVHIVSYVWFTVSFHALRTLINFTLFK